MLGGWLARYPRQLDDVDLVGDADDEERDALETIGRRFRQREVLVDVRVAVGDDDGDVCRVLTLAARRNEDARSECSKGAGCVRCRTFVRSLVDGAAGSADSAYKQADSI